MAIAIAIADVLLYYGLIYTYHVSYSFLQFQEEAEGVAEERDGTEGVAEERDGTEVCGGRGGVGAVAGGPTQGGDGRTRVRTTMEEVALTGDCE